MSDQPWKWSEGWNVRALVVWGTLGVAAGPTFLDLKDITGRHDSPPPREIAKPAPLSPGSGPPAARRGTVLTSALPDENPIFRAKRAIADCRARFLRVRDYTCTFIKRERLDGRLSPRHVMEMKSRSEPLSIYFKFREPNCGREAIYVDGLHDGRVLAHDVGLGRLLAGTMELDPMGSMAMEASRHPITEAGIGSLIQTVAQRWADELTEGESLVTFHPEVWVEDRPCALIESTHPQRLPGFLFHKVKLWIDGEHGLPTRFEAYDWPRRPGDPPELVEEYAYVDLQTDVGLCDLDFDPANPLYSFGRF